MTQCKLALSLLISTSLFSSVTLAHLSMKDEAVPMSTTSLHNWTGFYAGLNAGAVKYTMNITDNQAIAFNATLKQASNPHFTGGFQVGYRRQLDLAQTSGVYGAEFSANFADASFSKEYGSPFALYQLNVKNELQYLCLLQFIGGLAANRTLLFLAAGLSWTSITGSVTNLDSIVFFNSFNLDKKALGTAVGGGIEYAFTETISARLKLDVITPNVYTVSDGLGNNFQISNNIVQGTIGINYTFA